MLDLGIVPIFAEILNVLNKGSGEDSLDFLGFLTLPPTTSHLQFPILSLPSILCLPCGALMMSVCGRLLPPNYTTAALAV